MFVNFIILTILVALLASWVISFCHKFSLKGATLHDWATVYAPHRLVQEALNCHFCLSWWVCVVVSALACVVAGCGWFMLCPFFSTKITQFLAFGD